MGILSYRKKINSKGFSLVEALITMVIVLVVIGGATALFVQNQRATSAAVSVAMLRSNLRFALDVMSSELREIGAIMKASQVNVLSSYQIPLIECTNANFQNYGSVSNLGHYQSYDAGLPDKIRIVEPEIINDAHLIEAYHKPSNQMKSVKITGGQFQEGDILLITNANLVNNPYDPTSGIYSDLFVPTNIQPSQSNNEFTEITFTPGQSPLNSPQGLSNDYPEGSALMKVRIWEYYIDDTTDPNIPKLYRAEVNNPYPELVAEYIEDMQVALGIDTDGDNYISPSEWINTAFDNITPQQLFNLRAIRLTLVGRTGLIPKEMAGKDLGRDDLYYHAPAVEDHNPTGPYSSTTIPYFREVYTTTIYLRNLRPFPKN